MADSTQQSEAEDEEKQSHKHEGVSEHLHVHELPESLITAAKTCPECATSIVQGAIKAATAGSVPGALAAVGTGLATASVELAKRTAEVHGAKIVKGAIDSARDRVVGEVNKRVPGLGEGSDGLSLVQEIASQAQGTLIALGQERLVEWLDLTNGKLERIVNLVNSESPLEVERFIRGFRVSKGDTRESALRKVIKEAIRRYQSRS